MEFTLAFIETELDKWNNLFLFNQKFMSQFIFRGQANAEWNLKTSLERMIDNHHPSPLRDNLLPSIYEREMIREFRWRYPIYEKVFIPKEDEYIEWLALMQHYGASTRLLDFSYSMYVALFMALDGSFCDESSLWCINRIVLNNKVFEKYQQKNHTNSAAQIDIDNYAYQLANNSIEKGDSISPTVSDGLLLMVRPHMINQRLSHQQGLFLVPSIANIPYSDILKNYYIESNKLKIDIKSIQRLTNERMKQDAISVIKINIPKQHKYRLTKALEQMNITAETMYPGIEGLAKSTNVLRYGLGEYKE